MSDVKSYEELLGYAEKIVVEACEVALNPGIDLQVATKSNRNDLVTAVDKKVEEIIARKLADVTDYPLLGEENHSIDSFDGRVWVLDPIDGTMNYVETHRDYAISLALCEDGVPVLGVVADVVGSKIYTAIRGGGARCNGEALPQVDPDRPYSEAVVITDLKEMNALPRLIEVLKDSRGHRRYGSAALELVEVASSRAGAFVHLWVSPWDIAAAMLICQETGALVTRLDGTPLDVRHKGSILAGWPTVHSGIHDRLIVQAM